MESAAQALAQELEQTEFQETRLPVIANATALPVREPQEVREALVRQITSPVLWAQSMQWCLKQGHRRFLEIGPGKTLQGMLRRIDPDAPCFSVKSGEHVASAVEVFGGTGEDYSAGGAT
jgi:[acyl-carrier-protein] S-malonyltransferase